MLKKNLLVACYGVLWFIAGINVLNIGISAALSVHSLVWIWSLPVFAAFFLMFFAVTRKNVGRIHALEGDKAPLYKFMPLKSYLLIIFMMTLGITLRKIESIPSAFFAFFYTGLGSALCTAGIISLFKTNERARK